MKLHPRVSRSAVELVKSFEAFRDRAERTPDGGWTVGFGHTRTAREGAVVSRPDAEALLLYDLSEVGRALDSVVFAPLNDNQFNALAAFGFNIGLENLRRSSALRRVNEGNYMIAAAAIEQWRKAALDGDSQVVDALVRRRAAEKALFLTPPEGFPRSSTPVMRPQFDPDPLAPEIPIPLGELEPDASAAAPRTLAAAESVSARLQQIVYGGAASETEAAEPPPADEPEPVEQPPAAEAAAPPWSPAEPEPLAAPEPEPAPEAAARPEPASTSRFAGLFPRIFRTQAAPQPAPEPRAPEVEPQAELPPDPEATDPQAPLFELPSGDHAPREPEPEVFAEIAPSTGAPEPAPLETWAEPAVEAEAQPEPEPAAPEAEPFPVDAQPEPLEPGTDAAAALEEEEAPPPPFEVELDAPPPPVEGSEPAGIPFAEPEPAPALSCTEGGSPDPATSAEAHPIRAAGVELVDAADAAPRPDNRRTAAWLALVGLVMFLGALMAIWQGQPSPVSLLIGLLGVAGMAGGYFVWTSGPPAAGPAKG